ncbi:flippase-like domain-containing protein [Microbacterium jejuense]|uniref:Flippase-like domain-containing protein n=1 Tax=Microbacterium jejuense TaxID=1263637 RepID=A0ABS7HHF5_9MICO|nr:lysylphosphatidylglycerol synthase transmembrane domain-containing protein [Microbacterium jejuense]MBW9092356.1 flippase-like domain-containing protein [Microbacterium jejuense]
MAALTATALPAARRVAGRPAVRTVVRVAAGLAVVAATALIVGVGPFLHGVTAITPAAVIAAIGLIAVSTAAAAWRWRVVATGFGMPLPWHEAFGAYYRSQFLNAVLPGGVVGDVHRAYAHGRPHERVGGAARAVAAERVFGQVVQFTLTVAVLLPLAAHQSAWGAAFAPVAWGAGGLAALAALGVGVAAVLPRPRRALRREFGMLRPLLVRPAAVTAIVLSSTVVVAAHVALFVVAALATGVDADPGGLLAAGLVVLAASALPINVGGWGPREAAAGAAFALAGFGGAAGVATSTAFGVLALLAVAPGALVLLVGRSRDTSPALTWRRCTRHASVSRTSTPSHPSEGGAGAGG